MEIKTIRDAGFQIVTDDGDELLPEDAYVYWYKVRVGGREWTIEELVAALTPVPEQTKEEKLALIMKEDGSKIEKIKKIRDLLHLGLLEGKQLYETLEVERG